MASNHKVEENRPHLKFNFTFWNVHFSCTIIEPLLTLSGGAAAECSSGAGQLYITKYF